MGWRSSPAAPLAAPGLDPGEAQAIALAEELRAHAILIDDRSGREAAEARRLRAVGTLAVLEAAAARGLLDFPASADRLLKTNFRISRKLLDDAMKRAGANPASGG